MNSPKLCYAPGALALVPLQQLLQSPFICIYTFRVNQTANLYELKLRS